tara:strand:- start:350 stop:487 length:138 start_codon:yes stop_codon:yes gene_type:complete
MKLQQVKNQYTITIPLSIVRFKGWQKEDVLEWKEDGKGNPTLIKK